jgi:acetyltransferase-like isoleucine patch superfamily enzyme
MKVNMRADIKKFLKSQEEILIIEHKGEHNILYEWPKIRNPLKVILNTITIKALYYFGLKIKVFFLRKLLGVKIGKNVGISPEVNIDIFYPSLLTIEDNVIIGWKVNILCHEFLQDHIRLGRVTLKKNCTVGAFCLIRAGVTIGENSIIAMHSFVNRDIPPNEIWGGTPVQFIKKID